MKKEVIKKGQEAEAVSFLSNRTDDDFDAIDASVKEIISKVREKGDSALYELTESTAARQKTLSAICEFQMQR